MTAYVFISHCPQDAEWARFLAAELERQGVRAWLGVRDAQPGTDPQVQADHFLSQAAALVALVGQAGSSTSPVRLESDRALQLGKPIYPVRLVDVPAAELPALRQAPFWTDAFGPQAASNVTRLSGELHRSLGYGPPPAGASHPGHPSHAGYVPPAGHSGPKSPLMPVLMGVAGVALIGLGLWRISESGVFDSVSSYSSNSSATTESMNMTIDPAGVSTAAATPAKPSVTTQALAGRWTTRGFDCSTPGLIFTADGRWGLAGGNLDSRFAAYGDFYSTTGPGGRELTYRVVSFDGNVLVTEGVNNPWGGVLTRCPD